jgi:hypothetical protein
MDILVPAVPLVYQSKSHTLLLLLVALLAGVVSLQSGGGRWRDVTRDLRLEAHDDSIAIHEDAAMLRDSAKSAPVELKMVWASIRYNVTALHASARAETKVAVTEIAPRRKIQ